MVSSQKPGTSNFEQVTVGVIVGTWGLNGHVKVKRFGSSESIFYKGSVLLHDDDSLTVIDVRAKTSQYGDMLIVRFDSFDNLDKASALIGVEL